MRSNPGELVVIIAEQSIADVIISTTKEKSKKGTPSAQPTPQTPNIATPISNMTDLINGPASSPFESFNTALSDQPFVFDDLLGNPDMGFPLFSHPPP
jgi:hypothetical protein